MSADNWARCPRCVAREHARLEARRVDVNAMYGTVPVDEFDAARQALAAAEVELENMRPTFRENYDIFGAETGTVTISYRGQCQNCGLKLSIRQEHPIPDWDKP